PMGPGPMGVVKPDSTVSPPGLPALTTAGPGNVKKPADGTDSQGLRAATNISESMPPENAAQIIEQLARSGKMDDAVALLVKLSPRQPVRVRPATSDENLPARLFEKVRKLPPPTPPGGP